VTVAEETSVDAADDSVNDVDQTSGTDLRLYTTCDTVMSAER